MVYTPPGRWSQKHIATILGITETSWSKVLSGQIYPARLQTMQKIEVVFGWPVSEQVQLIPLYWEWPEQATTGKPNGEPTDLRYAMKLARVVSEWCDANPRTVSTQQLKLHPSLKPISRQEGPRFGKANAERKVVGRPANAPEKPFVPPKGPVLK